MPKPTDKEDQPINPLIEARRKRAMPKPQRGRGWIIAGLVVVSLILFGFFGLPSIVKSQAIKILSAELNGRTVTIGKIRLNPLVLSGSIEDFVITNPDGTPFISWRRAYANFDSFSIFTGQWRFQDVELEDFAANVSRGEDARFNFQDLIEKFTPAEASVEPAAPSRPLYVGRVVVSGAKLDFSDHSLTKPFETAIGPISFELNRFNTSGDVRAPYQFEAVTESDEHFAWSGSISLSPMRSQGELSLAGIELKKYSPYHIEYHNADLLSGRLDFSGRYQVDLSGESPVAIFEGGALTLRDFSVAVRGSKDPVLALKQLAITGMSADLAAYSAGVEHITLDGGHAHLTRDVDGAINALQLWPQSIAAKAVSGPTGTGSPSASPAFELPDFRLGELVVSGFSVDVDDAATPRPAKIAIESVDFTLANFALLHLDQKMPIGLNVKFATGGTVSLNGEAAVQPLAAAAKLAVTDFAITPFSPYIEPLVNIRLADGRAHTAGSVVLENNTVTYAGGAGLDKLVVLDPVQAETFVSWTSVALNGLRLISDPMAIHLDEIMITDPAANLVVNADGTPNIVAVLNPPSAQKKDDMQKPAEAVAAAPLPEITIDKVSIRAAKLGYQDRSVRPAARSSLSLEGDITGLSSAQLARADVNLTGKVDGSAPIAITGKLNPLGKPAYSQLTLDFQDIELPAAVSPYIGKFAGYELSRGRLTLDIDFSLNDRKIKADNVITLDQFTLGARTNSPDATKLPVSLGIALLKDSSGQIVLDVPIKGSLDDPEFKISRVVLRVITNILVKAATSPFSLLGAAFGGGGDELAYQQLSPGAVQPASEELKKLETVAKALLARPALQLDIQGNSDSVDDRAALKQQRLQARLRNRLWEQLRVNNPDVAPPDQLTITPEQNAELLLALYAETFPPSEGAVAPVMASSDGELLATPEPTDSSDSTSRNMTTRRGPRGSITYGRNSSASSSISGSVEVLAVPEGTPGAPSELMTTDGVPVLTPEVATAKLAAAIEVTDDDLNALAEARAQAVRAWLTESGKVPADRIFINAVGNKGPRVEFTLR